MLRCGYRWNTSIIVTDLILMGISDFLMLRKQTPGIKRRTESCDGHE
ncbi:MAG TPA: hypothetical protein VKU38_11850 [Ktedonobacteraceae bacterium]|nr:hypothetical protein [Ktedonobacteraceae bacterium]